MHKNLRKVYVGIDVHSREHKAAIMPIIVLEQPGTDWKRIKPLNLRNNITDFQSLHSHIMEYASHPEEVAIAVDHTGGHYSEPLVHYLLGKGYNVYHLEPKAVKAARDRLLDVEDKRDSIDSNSAAYLLYLRDRHDLSFRISAVIPQMSASAASLHLLILQRWQYNKLATQATNRLHQLLLAVFPEGEAKYFKKLLEIVPYYPTPKEMLASPCLEDVVKLQRKDKENILRLAADTVGVPGEPYRFLITDLNVQRIEAIRKRDELAEIISREVYDHPYGNILTSFPCLGEIVAATIIGVVKDIERWPNKKKFKKALGVDGVSMQSGTSTHKSRQGREGSKDARRVLFQVCFGCARTNIRDNDFKDYYLRQVARGKPRLKALVSTMGKLAEIIYHCLKTNEPYEYRGKYRVN